MIEINIAALVVGIVVSVAGGMVVGAFMALTYSMEILARITDVEIVEEEAQDEQDH